MNKTKILIIEDQKSIRDLLNTSLSDWGYTPIIAINGEDGWEKLKQDHDIKTILVDRIMPVQDGISFLKKLRQSKFRDIPAIMITSRDSKQDILDGIEAGAQYYLSKPIETQLLKAILKVAITDYATTNILKHEIKVYRECTELLTSCTYKFRTPSDLNKIVPLLSHTCHNQQEISIGLYEIMLNAIEHGNLGISYDRKTQLIKSCSLDEEIDKLLQQKENLNKFAEITYTLENKVANFYIADNGPGFDWNKYLSFNPDRVFDNHGRGIAFAKAHIFSKIEYLGKGNEVVCSVDLA